MLLCWGLCETQHLIHSCFSCHSRYERFLQGQKSLSECQKLLHKAKKDMLGIFGNLQADKFVSAEDKTLFRYYCEAILILGHFQRPGAVEGMTVSTLSTVVFLSAQNMTLNRGWYSCHDVSNHVSIVSQVTEWLNKNHVNGRVCVGVSQHKTSTMQIATFALTTEESAVSSITE